MVNAPSEYHALPFDSYVPFRPLPISLFQYRDGVTAGRQGPVGGGCLGVENHVVLRSGIYAKPRLFKADFSKWSSNIKRRFAGAA